VERDPQSAVEPFSAKGAADPPEAKAGMTETVYEAKHKEALDALLLGLPGVRAGKMFGYPAYYVNDRLFACVYGSGVGVKVPPGFASELLKQPHVVPFQPLGKPKMKEWVQINRSRPADYRLDLEIFQVAVEFVSRLSKNGGTTG
jgi:hypothetical protein